MKELTKPAGILLLIAAVAAALLGIIHDVTAGPIATKSAATQAAAMQEVFPDAESFETVEDAPLSGTISAVNVAKDASGSDAGYVITVAPSGFGGPITTMVGVTADGTVTGISVLSLSETPGLGARATEEGEGSFKSQFEGFSGNLAVTKDGGDIVPITSATITSRAVTSGVKEAVDLVAENGGAK